MASNQCNICRKRLLAHSGQIRCTSCSDAYHLKCITLDSRELDYLRCYAAEWLCCDCIVAVFPFNNIEEDHEFLARINNIDTLGLIDDDLICHLFEINDYDHRSPLCEIDPDLYFYNSVDLTDAIQCNHYDEKTFCEADFHRGNNQTGGVFFICHLNIRSMKKKS